MAVPFNEEQVNHALECIRENATLMESKERKDKPESIVYRYAHRYTIPNSVYTKFMNDEGFPPEEYDKLTSLQQSYNTAAAMFAAEKLKEIVPTALADKEYIKAVGNKNIKASLNTLTKDGKNTVTVNGYCENRNPSSAPGENQITEHYGRVDIRHTITRGIATEAIATIEADMEKMYKKKY